MSKVHAGIWIDSREALVFVMDRGSEHFVRIHSEVEDYHIHGGARSSTPYGPQDAVKEKKNLHRRQHQFQQFFDEVLQHVTHSDEVLICGPGQAKHLLEKTMLSDKSQHYRLVGCHDLDSLTENQIRAWIREMFGLGRKSSGFLGGPLLI